LRNFEQESFIKILFKKKKLNTSDLMTKNVRKQIQNKMKINE